MVLQEFEYQIIVFQGKPDLLLKLGSRLKGYAPWITEDFRILVLVDRDNDDCRQLKKQLDAISRRAGLVTKTNSINGYFQVINRIVIEELEAWYFGDPVALHNAYPKLPMNLHKNSRYRNPDSIANGTWENLERILQRAGYFPSGLSKIHPLASEITLYDPFS